MTVNHINEKLFSIDEVIRGEIGPPLKRAKATKELLSDEVTARHYQVGERDAENNIIEEGKEMAYLDWKNKDQWCWYLYRWTAMEGQDKDGKTVDLSRFVEVEQFAGTKDEAIARAQELHAEATA